MVLSNLITDLPEALAFQFFDLYFHNPPKDWSKMGLEKMKQTEAKEKPPQRPTSPAPPLALTPYAGTFSHPAYGQITITPEKDQLFWP